MFGGFVRNFGRVFATLLEVLLVEIQEESITLLVGRGSRGAKIVNTIFVNKLAFPNFVLRIKADLFSRILFSFLPTWMATPLPPLFSAPFRPFLHSEKCSVL